MHKVVVEALFRDYHPDPDWINDYVVLAKNPQKTMFFSIVLMSTFQHSASSPQQSLVGLHTKLGDDDADISLLLGGEVGCSQKVTCQCQEANGKRRQNFRIADMYTFDMVESI